MAVVLLTPTLTDEELATRARDGDEAALAILLGRYRRLARAKSRSYFLLGADADDLEQEGMIALCKAVRDFRPERQPSFRGFAELCVTRQVISAIKAATRHKHQPLNRYVSISGVRGSDDPAEHCVEALLDDHRVPDPADEVVARERFEQLRRDVADVLSGLEAKVLGLYLSGQSYEEIGDRLGRHAKSVDNALQRIKRKLDGHLRLEEPSLVA